MKKLNKTETGSGFLLKKNGDVFEIHTKKEAFQGSLKDIWQFMCFDLDIEDKEIRAAINEMAEKNKNTAHFGIFGSLMFVK